MIQLAWLWLRHQPHSALTLWFQNRIKRNGGRLRKTTIVALARKLLVALWKYVTAGVVIEGAMMRPPDDSRSASNTVIFQDLISPGGSRWTNRSKPMALNAVFENGSRLPEPCPPQAGCWCSRRERRPNVRLIVPETGRVMQSGSDLGCRSKHRRPDDVTLMQCT